MHAREQKLELPSRPPAVELPSRPPAVELVTAATSEPGRQGTAVIVAEGPDRSWMVEDRGQQLQARRAASCLLEPAVGDRVWLVVEGERCYVLAVLERNADAPATLRVDGDAKLRVDGRLEVHAVDDLQLRSDRQVGIAGDEFQVQARVGRVFVRECTAVLRSLLTHATHSTLVAKLVETLADRVSTSSKTSCRNVTEIDQLHAGIIDHQAVEAARIAADKVIINGGEIAKVEAGQIHLG
jgi:hypothetical protein